MRRSSGVLVGVALVTVVLVGSGAREVCAEDLGVKAREAFVKTRNTCELVDALERLPVRDDYTATDAQLALAACDRVVSPAETTERGYAALLAVIGASKKLDVDAAAVAAERVGDEVAGGIGVWARALVLARRGHDDEAIAALAALPTPAESARARASFSLALFGAALPEDDRLLLAAMGRAVLLAECRSGDVRRIVGLSRSLAALDREVGSGSLCLAFRALRRLARHKEADQLVVAPEVAGHLDAQRATCWSGPSPSGAAGNRSARARSPSSWRPRLRTSSSSTPCVHRRSRFERPRCNPRPRTYPPRIACRWSWPASRPFSVSPPRRRTCSRPRRGRGQGGRSHVREGLARVCGCRVAFAAGSGRAGEAALARDLPFLFYEIRLEEQAFLDLPAIVRGRDAENGLWILEDADLRRPDVRPADAARKAWFLIAAGPDASESPEAWIDRSDQLLGRVVFKGLGHAAAGDVAAGSAYLDSQAVNVGGPVVFDLYRAFLYYRRYAKSEDVAPLQLAFEAVSRSLETSPHLAFELVVQGQGLFAFEREVETALLAFDEAQRLAPFSAWLARTRWLLLASSGELSRALDALELARVLDPTDTTALYHRGRRRTLGGDVPGARGDLRRAFDRNPAAQEVTLELAGLELSRRDARASLDVILAFLEQVPEAATDDDVARARFAAEASLVQAATRIEDLRPLVESPLEETRRRVVYSLARLENSEARRCSAASSAIRTPPSGARR